MGFDETIKDLELRQQQKGWNSHETGYGIYRTWPDLPELL
jgi:hypothetical protein